MYVVNLSLMIFFKVLEVFLGLLIRDGFRHVARIVSFGAASEFGGE